MKTYLISGARGALGSEMVSFFLRKGEKVIGTDLQCPQGKGLVEDPEKPNLRWLHMDVTVSESVQSGAKTIEDAGYEVDGIIHCAGGFRFSHSDQISDPDLDFLIDLNLRSAFLFVRAFLPGMKKRDFGRLVFISANSTLNPGAGMGPYAATKAGLNALVSSLSQEVKSSNINVNAVLPSIIDTPANRKDMPQAKFEEWVSTGQLSEIVYQLTQSWGKPIHGALIPVVGRV